MPESIDTTITLKRNLDEVVRSVPPTKMECPLKPLDLSSRSLASLMSSRRSALASMHKKFSYELSQQQQQRRRVCFDEITSMKLPSSLLPSSSSAVETSSEPPLKRRRFQRRNSKTAAMLITSMSAMIARGDLEKEESEKETTESVIKSKQTNEDNAWDGGLEIAEDLVRHLKLRRQAKEAAATSSAV